MRHPSRNCWLIEAVEAYDEERVEALLTCPGVQVDQPDGAGNTALLRVAARIGERTRSPHPTASTQTWVMDRLTSLLGRLVKAGANVNATNTAGATALILAGAHRATLRVLLKAGARETPQQPRQQDPLQEALRRGDDAVIRFWLQRPARNRAPDAPNPWADLLPYLVSARVPPRRSSLWSTPQPKPALSARRAWALAARLVAAGFPIDAPLVAPAPAPATPSPPSSRPDLTESRFEVNPDLDTPLVRACLAGDTRAVDRLLAMGANPHHRAPNGRHPFMAWWSGACASHVRRSDEGWAALHAGALRFLSPDLLIGLESHTERGFPTYTDIHPLAAVLLGPCASSDPCGQAIGWSLARTLLAMGVTCPLPRPELASVVERVLGRTLSALRGRVYAPMPPESLSTLKAFLMDLPGWREAQATVCADAYNFASCLVSEAREGLAESPRDRSVLRAFGETGLDWKVALAPSPVPYTSRRTPLKEVCKHDEWRDKATPPLPQAPLMPEAIAFFLEEPAIDAAERDRGFQALVAGGERENRSTVLALFHAHGYDFTTPRPGQQGIPLTWLAQHPATRIETMEQLFALGVRLAPEHTGSWPKDKAALWESWTLQDHFDGHLDATACATRRTRL